MRVGLGIRRELDREETVVGVGVEELYWTETRVRLVLGVEQS